jgi:hypothetical protein
MVVGVVQSVRGFWSFCPLPPQRLPSESDVLSPLFRGRWVATSFSAWMFAQTLSSL